MSPPTIVEPVADSPSKVQVLGSSGQHISFSQQIQQVMDTYQQFILTMGEHAAADHISNSVFYISWISF
ncbi:hypothetical protein Hanom_Chr01g00045151 [Helianthus anomalus]